jgi:hypothetical protein
MRKLLVFLFIFSISQLVLPGCDDDSSNNNDNQEICDDGTDNDGDSDVDCEDSDCVDDPACTGDVETNCSDDIDNDNDGDVDCDDADCVDDPACTGDMETNCSDGLDNDEDGLTDCDDSDCAGSNACEGPAVENCGTPQEPTNSTCDVNAGTNDLVLIKGNVLTGATTYVYGEVLVDSATRKIVCTGCDCSGSTGYNEATVLNCGSNVVSPALINSHDHIRWIQVPPVGSAEWPGGHGEIRYEHRNEWRQGLNGYDSISKPGNGTSEQMTFGELRQIMSGTVTLFGSGSAEGLMRNVDKDYDAELPGVNAPIYETFPLHSGSNGFMTDSGCAEYEYSQTTLNGNSFFVPHVSEGIATSARNEFICMTGLEPDGHDLLGPNSTYIHAIGMNASDVSLMASEGGNVIWSPRTNIDLYGATAPVVLMDRMGIKLGLGTDWTITGSMNMLRELKCAQYLNENHYYNYFSNYKLWRMATVDNAAVLGVHEFIGDLAVDLYADIVVFNANGATDYHKVVIDSEVADVAMVMRGGDVLFGDANITGELGSSCDNIDVCGNAKQVCILDDLGVDLDALETSVAPIGEGFYDTYPLFYCDTPYAEPTCMPSREGEYSGINSQDSDGDGINDDEDNCPLVFNPIRPMDNGVQSDIDNDNQGDECDPCPLDADTSNCTFDPSDIDNDGYSNVSDNCPYDANPNQEDSDGDEIGDLCDPCPDANQNGATGGSIPALRQECHADHVPPGVSVTISGVVTAVDDDKFYIQDMSVTGYGGMYIYMGSDPMPVTASDLGKEVQVTGVYEEYYEQTQISFPESVNIINNTPVTLTPIVVDISEINNSGTRAEELEGMLIGVDTSGDNVQCSDANPDDPDDYQEMEVQDTSGDTIRIDDDLYDGYTTNRNTSNIYTTVRGIAVFSFGNRKILPRFAEDLVEVQ